MDARTRWFLISFLLVFLLSPQQTHGIATHGHTNLDRKLIANGGMKVGHFTVAFNDLEIPLAGMPITVTYTFESIWPYQDWHPELAALEVQYSFAKWPMPDRFTRVATGTPAEGSQLDQFTS